MPTAVTRASKWSCVMPTRKIAQSIARLTVWKGRRRRTFGQHGGAKVLTRLHRNYTDAPTLAARYCAAIASQLIDFIGAPGRTRTSTPLRATDFELPRLPVPPQGLKAAAIILIASRASTMGLLSARHAFRRRALPRTCSEPSSYDSRPNALRSSRLARSSTRSRLLDRFLPARLI